MAVSFCMQGFGIVLAAVVSFVVAKTVVKDLQKSQFDAAWRICLGIGAVPCLFSLVIRHSFFVFLFIIL